MTALKKNMTTITALAAIMLSLLVLPAAASVTYDLTTFAGINNTGTTSVSDANFNFTGSNSASVNTINVDKYGIYLDVNSANGDGSSGTINIAPASGGAVFSISSVTVAVYRCSGGLGCTTTPVQDNQYTFAVKDGASNVLATYTVTDTNNDGQVVIDPTGYNDVFNYKTITFTPATVSAVHVVITGVAGHDGANLGTVTGVTGFVVANNPAAPSPPTVTNISPNSGPTAGGTSVTITGTNFISGGTTATIGGAACTSPSVTSATTLTCTTPAGSAGTASVLATTAGGTNSANTLFTYIAPAPTVTTQAVSGISATSATGNGNITATGGVNATTRGVIYYAYTNSDKIIGDAGVTNISESGSYGTGAFTASLTSLSVNIQYNARAYATNAGGTGYGSRVAFWTLANVPAAPTVNNPTATTLDVAVNGNGNPSGTEFAIQETGGNYVQADGTLGASAVWQTTATWGTKTVTGLTTGTTYTFQVKARNGASTETAYGATASGTPVAAPTVTSQAASTISATAATGNGNITATNGANATARGVVYYAYTNTDKIIGDAGVTNVSEAGSFTTGAFTASLTSLSVNTQYNARAYATSPNGTGYGARVSFWTLANVPAAPTVGTPTATTLDVTVNVNGNPSGTEFAIQETGTGNYVQAGGTLGASAVWQTAATWGTKTVTGLTTGTTYTFQVKARNGASTETAYGATASGTPVAAPTVTSQAASSISATAATGNGNITATNGANATARGVVYYAYTDTDKIIGDAGVTNVSEAGSFTTGAFTASLTSISVNTQYNARAYATSPNGTGYGARVAFWTLANVPAAPTVNTPTATTLNVAVNVNSNPAATEFCIQETSTGNYVQAGGTLGASAVWQTAATWGAKTVTGLTTGTTYTFQVKARNGGSTETAYGATTAGVPVASPTVTTQAASAITATATTGNGNITATNGANATARGVIYWGYNNTDQVIGDGGVTNITESGSFGTGAFTEALTSLAVNTQYNARAYATSPNGTGYGARVSFWTLANLPAAPTVNTPTATTLNVAVNVNNNPAATEFCIQETSTGNYVQAGGTLAGGQVWQTAATWGTKTVTGLTTGTTYTFQVKARNGGATETAYGATTAGVPVASPTVTTQAASAITATAATGNGSITATNGANATARGVIYWGYNNTDQVIGDGGVTNITESGSFGTGAFTEALTSLAVNTQYNARAYATSPNGTGYGARVAFWTLANVPAAPTVNTPTATTLNVAVNVNSNPAATEFCIQETSTGNYVQAGGTLGAGQVWQTAATWGTKTVTGLTTGTTYTFQVKARNGATTETAYGATTAGVPVAATLTVTTASDSGAGSLRQAIIDANPGDAITFAAGLSGQTITLASTLTINKDLTISGPGAASLTISAGGSAQLFQVSGATTFTLEKLTIANGAGVNGGALTDNATATTTITGCAFTGNSATGNGGAISAAGTMTISDTLFNSNSALQGGAIYTAATLSLTNVTLTGNNATGNGGAIYNSAGTATIINATISGNSAATQGGGIDIAGGTLNLKNSIIANNSAPSGTDIFGTITSQGYNLIRNTTGATVGGDTTGNITGSDPLLGTLAVNGGPTRTMALLSGSPAIDAATATGAPAADQRGMSRPQNGLFDMGAYERGAAATLTATGGTPQTAAINAAFTTPLTAKVVDSLGGVLDGVSIAFSGPGSGAGISANGSAASNSSGIASYSATANGTAGAYTVTATVNALTASFSLTNGQLNQSISFTNPGNQSYGSGNVSLNATATSGLTVSFTSLTTAVCTVSGTSAVLATAGTCTIAADQGGNGTYNAAPQVTQSFTVNKAAQTIGAISFTPATLNVGGTTTASATATSGLGVAFTSTTPTVCTVSGSTVTAVAAGACTIAANQGGDANYNAAAQATQTITIAKGNQTIGAISFSPATLNVGGTATASATATSGLAVAFSSTTPAVCTASGATVTGVSAGTCTITANQAGNAGYSAAPAVSQNLTVAYSTTPPALSISTLADNSVTNNATLNVSGTATGINGIASVTVNGTATTLAAGGTFSMAITLQTGKNTITTVATDNAGTTTTDSRSITLDTATPAITISSPADNSTLAASSVTVTGTVDENATVQASVNGGSAQSAAMSGTSFSVTLNLSEGSNTIEISATDLAGNSATIKRTLTSDTTKPTLAITDPAQDVTTSQATMTVSGTVSDSLTAVSVTIACDGQTYTPQIANGTFQQQLSFATQKQYAITVTASDLAGNSVTVQRNVIYASSRLPSGDINGDGTVDISDALLALQMTVGLATPTPAQLAAGDVAPLVDGKPAPDGVIDIGDAAVILEKVVGLVTW